MKPHLILIPGFGSDERLWSYQLQHLRDIANIQVIVLKDQDNRQAMAEFILEQAPERFVLAGHSLGGWVAQVVAAQAVERVQKLILMATWTRYNVGLVQSNRDFLQQMADRPLKPWLEQNLPDCIHPTRLADRVFVEALLKMQCDFPKAAYFNQSRAMANDRGTGQLLRAIACPTLVIQARQDRFFAVEEGEAIAAEIPNATITIIENCGHMIPMEQPQATTAWFRDWLT